MARRERPAWMRGADILDLVKLSVPIAVSRMSMMLMALTDAIVLGQVAEGELSFVLNSWIPIGVSLGLGMGLLLGVQVLTSEFVGTGKQSETGRIFRRGSLWALGLGVGLMVLVYASAQALFEWMFVTISPNSEMSLTLTPQEVADEIAKVTRILSFGMVGFMLSTVFAYYLEALRMPLAVTVLSYLAVGANVVIDCALVLGMWGMPQMGAEGVAWATTGSRWFMALLMFGYILWKTPAFAKSSAGPPGEAARQLRVGIGTAISNVAEWGGFNLTYAIALFISVAVNTVYGYSVQIMGVCFMLFLGIGTATSVRVAEYVGRGDWAGVRDASRLGVMATFLLGGVLALIVIVFQNIIPLGLVHKGAEIDGLLLAPAIAGLLIFAAIGTTFDGLQATASMALRAQGVVWRPSLIHVGSFFVIMLPATYWLGVASERGGRGMMEGVVIGVGIAGLAQWALLEKEMARHRLVTRHSKTAPESETL
jgi:MATE family multidrug resistance protein